VTTMSSPMSARLAGSARRVPCAVKALITGAELGGGVGRVGAGLPQPATPNSTIHGSPASHLDCRRMAG
jgi:hypothetical protein